MAARRSRFTDVVRGAVVRRGAALMGICNVTPDSFSDGGRFFAPDAAAKHIEELLAEGADILDIGGESTRPGSSPVSTKEQLERVIPAIRHAAKLGACISIDTMEPHVASAALDAGAHAVNDVSLLRNPDLASIAAGMGAALVLSHAREAQDKKWGLSYNDIVADVIADWENAAGKAMQRGLPREALVMDPGLGFAKTARHSFELLRRIGDVVKALEVPVLVGASRKSFLGLIDKAAEPAERDGASLVAALHAVHRGVRIVRVHDVRATRQALDMETVLGSSRRKI